MVRKGSDVGAEVMRNTGQFVFLGPPPPQTCAGPEAELLLPGAQRWTRMCLWIGCLPSPPVPFHHVRDMAANYNVGALEMEEEGSRNSPFLGWLEGEGVNISD